MIQDERVATIRAQERSQEEDLTQAAADEDQHRRTAVLADLLQLVNLKNIKKPKLNQRHLTIINLLLPPMLNSIKQPSSNVSLRATMIEKINKYQPKYLKPTNTPKLCELPKHQECLKGYSSQRVLSDETNWLEYDEDVFFDELDFEEGGETNEKNNDFLAEASIEETMFEQITSAVNNLDMQLDDIMGPDATDDYLEDI